MLLRAVGGVEQGRHFVLTEPHLHVVALVVLSKIHRVRLPRITVKNGRESSLFGGFDGVIDADSVRLYEHSRTPSFERYQSEEIDFYVHSLLDALYGSADGR